MTPPCGWAVVHGCTGGYGIRPYGNRRLHLAPEGSIGRGRKGVKKNAALLHFLAFAFSDHNFGVLRGEQPLSRAAVRSRSDQSPSGALKRTSVPALLDGGARCAPPSGRLGSSGTFLLLFWSQKRRKNGGHPLNSSAPPQGGGTR